MMELVSPPPPEDPKMISTFAEAEERLAEALPTYESRPQQQALARKIEECLAGGTHLIGEAGCGCGKSFGYSIPSILHAVANRGRSKVVISTYTKALQSQLVDGDLPFLQEHLGVDFSFALLKGRSNYLCRAKLAESDGADILDRIVAEVGQEIYEDPQGEYDGDVEALPITLSIGERAQATITSDDCPGRSSCPFGDICFAERAKAKAAQADVIVANHALYFTDMVIQEKTEGAVRMLPQHDVVVFDEAHEIEEAAGNILGSKITQPGIRHNLTVARNFLRDFGGNGEQIVGQINSSVDSLWRKLEEGRIRQNTLTRNQADWMAIFSRLEQLAEEIDRLDVGDDRTDLRRKGTVYRRVAGFVERFRSVIGDSFEATVRWVEKETVQTRQGKSDRLVIKYAPINVGEVLDRRIWNYVDPHTGRPGPTALLVSATLTVAGRFDYISGRLGMSNFESIDVGTPFDFQKQSGLYVPKNLPEPTQSQRAAWGNAARVQMADLVRASDGRALLLFSSVREMQAAYFALSEVLPFTCMYQGMPGKTNKMLAEEFKSDTHSVLFATKSFFTGVDFQGETCSLVIMDKLPFAVPTDALNEARVEAVAKRTGNDYKAFMEYSVPLMALTLRQGFGRLIRHRTDSGIVAILDPRLDTKGYGKTILASLPDAPRLASLKEVSDFYGASA